MGFAIAKNVFQRHGVEANGKTLLRKQLKRHQVLACFAHLSPCRMGLEACSGAHYWARELIKLGPDARWMSPPFVKPYVKGNKNDANDAEAIGEAVVRPAMRFVPIKSIAPQDLQRLHRVRSGRVKERTALANRIRGWLADYGIIVALGIVKRRPQLPDLLEEAENGLTIVARTVFADLPGQRLEWDKPVVAQGDKLQAVHRASDVSQRLSEGPGISPITATALGDGKALASARPGSAWLGGVPRQDSRGGKPRLLDISKRGDVYLRTLLSHGARAVVKAAAPKDDSQSRWLNDLVKRRNAHIAAVAVANTHARMVGAVLTGSANYKVSAQARV